MFDSNETILLSHLDKGERLIWSGQPRRGIRLRAQDAFLIPFSLMWGGFAIFWETSVIRAGAPLFFILWGVPFVLVGCYLIVGRFFMDAYKRSHTYYGVTNGRILIASKIFSQQFRSLQLRTLPEITLTESSDGSGTITFGPALFGAASRGGNSWPGSGRNEPPAFELIENARDVYDIVRAAQSELTANH